MELKEQAVFFERLAGANATLASLWQARATDTSKELAACIAARDRATDRTAALEYQCAESKRQVEQLTRELFRAYKALRTGGDDVLPVGVSGAQRLRIFVRDQYQCRQCGASGYRGALLQVDHIHPVAEGGVAIDGNLQTLCKLCNSEKRASLLPRPVTALQCPDDDDLPF